MPSLTLVRRAAAAAAVTFALAAIAIPASAHAELTSSDPEDGATVAELTAIHLEFSEDLLEIGNTVTVTDGAGVDHDAVLTYPEPNQIDAVVSDVAPGAATIAWRNASVDGHTEEGELHVTVLEPSPSPSASASESPSPTPTVTVTATASPSASPSPSDSATADENGGGVSPWLWGTLGLVVIGGAAAAIIAATRRPPTE